MKKIVTKTEVKKVPVEDTVAEFRATVDKTKSGREWARSGMANHTHINPDFTGVARSIECFDNQGYRNFKILTLYIENGTVVMADYSDPYAQFEAISKLNHFNDLGTLHLNNCWKHKRTLSK